MTKKHFFISILMTALMILGDRQIHAQSLDIEALRTEAEITGLSFVLIEDGEIVRSESYGVRSSSTNPPITPGTVFEAESLTKPIVAYVALRMVEDGQLELDKPLADYVTYPDAAHDIRYLKITTRMVLSHTSGFPNFRAPGEALPILYEPGSFFTYSGEGFLFLQEALEKITFKTLEELTNLYVFEPLEMSSSSLVWNSEFGSKIAVGHTDMDAPLDKFVPQMANAAFSLHTTPSDYARFMLAFGRGEGLGRRLRKDLRLAQVDALDGIFWGFGWGLQPTMAGQAIWEWGDNSGYKSFAYLEPEAKKGFVMLSNSANGMLILHELFEEFIGGPQTAVRWLNYQRFDDPKYLLGRRVQYAVMSGGLEAARDAYDSAKADLPAEAIHEDALNSLGYRLLRQGLVDESVGIFSLNSELYKSSSNVFDSLGEALLAAGNLEQALASYEKSVKLNPSNQNGSAMIRLIKAQIAGN